MRWNLDEASWKELKHKFAFRLFRLSDDDRARVDPIGAKMSRIGEGDELQPAAFHPDDRGRRSEFSLHIGC